MLSYIIAIILIGFSSGILAQGPSQAVDQLIVTAPSSQPRVASSPASQGSKKVQVAPNTIVWSQWHQFDLSQKVSGGPGSNYKANTTINYYRLGVGHWFVPSKLLVGFSTAYYTAFGDSLFVSPAFLADPTLEHNASFKAFTSIKGLNVQPYLAYLITRVFFIDATGGFDSVEYKFRQFSIFREGIDQIGNSSSAVVDGYNLNFTSGINAVVMVHKLLFTARLGYLFIQTNRNAYTAFSTNGLPLPVKALTAYAHSVTFAVLVRWLLSKSIHPFAGFTYLYNFSRNPNSLIISSPGTTFPMAPNIVTNRSQYFYRTGVSIFLYHRFVFHFMYTRVDRGTQDGNTYLLRADVPI